MHAKIVAIDISSNGHGFKCVDKHFVDLFVLKLLENFLAEREMLSHGSAFVVASEHDNCFGVVELKREQED